MYKYWHSSLNSSMFGVAAVKKKEMYNVIVFEQSNFKNIHWPYLWHAGPKYFPVRWQWSKLEELLIKIVKIFLH